MKDISPEYLDPTLDREMVEHVCDPHLEEISNCQEMKHPSIQTGLKKSILVLWKPNIIKPSDHPLIIQKTRQVDLCQKIRSVLQTEKYLFVTHNSAGAG